MKQNLTDGNIAKKLILYFLPIAAGTILQQLYNAVDGIIVGKFVGTIALAAVGGSAAIIMSVLIGFFVALSGGCTVVIAQLFGAGDEERLKAATDTAVCFCIGAGLVLTVLGIVLTVPMLKLMQTPADTMRDSALYLRIIFLGVTSQLLYNVESGILRAVGDSRSPFVFLVISCLTNVALDLLFVKGFGMGVDGVAIATVMAQTLSAALAAVKLCRSKEAYRLSFRGLRMNRRILKHMMHIGIPTGFQAAMYSVSNMIIQVPINLLGTTVVASWALAGRIDGIFWATSNAAGIAVMNFAAQNFGAGKNERVYDVTKLSMKIFIAVAFCFSAFFLIVSRPVLPFFNEDIAVIDCTWYILRHFAPFYFIWTMVEVISGVLCGVGDAVRSVIFCGIGTCLLRVLWIIFIHPLYPNLLNLCILYPVTWAVTAAAFIIYFKTGKWERRRGILQD